MPAPLKFDVSVLTKIKRTLLEQEGTRAERTNYYIKETVVDATERLPIPRQKIDVDRPTVAVFADDAPLFNWAHPCRYLLHEARSGEFYREVAAQFPPSASLGRGPNDFVSFHEPVIRPESRLYQWERRVLLPKFRFAGDRYAVLFSGMSDNRHTNDLEFLYRTLRNVYQVPKQNIYVLNYDGTLNYSGGPTAVWPGDQTAYQMTVNAKGNKADLFAVFDDLKKRLKADDSLLIHTNNHGGHNGTESDLCCYPNWGVLGVKAFTDKLAELPKYRCLKVVMEQCHAGGFNSAVIARSTADATSIASACEELRNSVGGADFDPFAHDWIAAMTGSTSFGGALQHNPDANSDGKISAREAFRYADAIHHPFDTPVFHESGNGGACALGQDPFHRFKLPPFLVEQLIRKFWPEPDPLLFAKRLEAVLPELEALDREFTPRLEKLQQELEKKAGKLVQSAARIE